MPSRPFSPHQAARPPVASAGLGGALPGALDGLAEGDAAWAFSLAGDLGPTVQRAVAARGASPAVGERVLVEVVLRIVDRLEAAEAAPAGGQALCWVGEVLEEVLEEVFDQPDGANDPASIGGGRPWRARLRP